MINKILTFHTLTYPNQDLRRKIYQPADIASLAESIALSSLMALAIYFSVTQSNFSINYCTL